LIWTIDFRFGAHKMEATYTFQTEFIDEKEWCNDTNCKFTHRQLWRNERGKLIYPRWDNYLECSRFWIQNTYWLSLFWNNFFFLVPLSCATFDFTIVWVFLNCWFVGIIAILAGKIEQIICWH
jgi:hypothetical protein